MIGALFALALLMIVGGLAAMVQGIPFVRLEVGWTMVIAGTVGASGGAVLLGIAAATTRLVRIERLLATRAQPDFPAEPSRATLPPLPTMPTPPRPEAPAAEPQAPAPEPSPSPVAAALSGAGVAGAAALVAPELRLTRAEPDEAFGPPSPAPDAPLAQTPGAQEPAASPPPEEEARPQEPPAPELQAPEPPPAEPRADSAAPEEPPGPAEEPAPKEPAPAEPAPEEPEEPTIVGTYASGGNTYVMYSDGTIDAQTPSGKYRFTSLDELKTFIAEGGEAGDELRSGAA
ncbi:hypothetical protein [Methylobacterium nodulans]|uniref:Uncharacterized protein n=1 Tax=Methylobacterium nodulans (strain LMG 21967 / CNCM I-2342 / ORS 2060) TaxID=460265 RepID=B8IST3_METNO|nr:hypothetical protein [Methylobacterium nodulans]ACL60732.1 conserved hypothetical protein [Methylobacterium nodulans ORS 2060]